MRRVTAVYSEHPESDVPLINLIVTMMLIVMGVLELHSRPQGGPFDSQWFQRRFAARHREFQQRLTVQRVPCNSVYAFQFAEKSDFDTHVTHSDIDNDSYDFDLIFLLTFDSRQGIALQLIPTNRISPP